METKSELDSIVLEWPPEKVRAWLDGLIIGEPVEGEMFNWVGFAFTAAVQAREERSLAWANIALRVYESLVEREPDWASLLFGNEPACMHDPRVRRPGR